MKIENKIEPLLNGPMKFAGYTLLLLAVFFVYEGSIIPGIVVALLVSFFVFSFSGVEIDTTGRRIKQYNRIFGLFKTGRWKSLDAFPGITLVPMRRVNTFASRSNRTTTTIQNDYRIYLINKARKPAVVIKVCKNPEQAQNSLDEFSIWLKLPVYSIKR
jgi:hypothetical protein